MIRPGAASFGWSPDDFVYPQMRARQAPRLFCGFVLVVGVCVVCVGPLGAACVVLGGGCVWDVFLSGLTAGEGSGMVFRVAALVVVWLAGSAGWFWDRGFVVSGLVW